MGFFGRLYLLLIDPDVRASNAMRLIEDLNDVVAFCWVESSGGAKSGECSGVNTI